MANLIIEVPDDLVRSLEGMAAAQRKSVQQLALERLSSLVEVVPEPGPGSPAAVLLSRRTWRVGFRSWATCSRRKVADADQVVAPSQASNTARSGSDFASSPAGTISAVPAFRSRQGALERVSRAPGDTVHVTVKSPGRSWKGGASRLAQ